MVRPTQRDRDADRVEERDDARCREVELLAGGRGVGVRRDDLAHVVYTSAATKVIANMKSMIAPDDQAGADVSAGELAVHQAAQSIYSWASRTIAQNSSAR